MGPWLFSIMINDLDTPADLWKCVDDTSISETVGKGCESNLQRVVDDLSRQSSSEGFQLNEAKCKELKISFANSNSTFNPILLNGKPLEEDTSAKLLGLNISSDLKWNVHVLELVQKASCRFYFLRQLKTSQVTPEKLILFYITCIRSILEYACPVFHRALPGYLSEDLERLQKRALRIIYPGMSYNQALEFSGLPTLFKRREEISSKLFNEVVDDPGHTLHKLLPPKNPSNYSLRRNRDFALPLCKTDRCKKIFHFQSRF